MPRPTLTALAALALLAAAVPALAGPLEDGVAAADRGDFAKAVSFWKPLADNGNEFAQFDMGVLYATGQGVAKDDVEATRWFRLAAERGHREAQYNMGVALDKGRGVAADPAQAAQWYQKAADRGHPKAQYNLAGLYAEGEGVPQDFQAAYLWFNLAAARFPKADAAAKADSIKNRDLAAARLTPAALAEAQKQARDWKPVVDTAPSDSREPLQ
jgi:hypothetical protein